MTPKRPTNSRLKRQLKTMSLDELVTAYASYGLEQDQAMLREEQARANALVFTLKSIEDELKTRPGDQRSALMRLYDHPNAQVRLNAIRATLAVAPARGRAALEVLAKSKQYPAAGDAGMSLWALDQGIYKPT
ncbi:MAG: DUF2019 domain-containing protein [Methylobacteriaceae bacterium]|nr:DUF2019 domain-containing protein [Methylobacteriaceae bacterium]MBV9394799.1 DUF2019 domain-containing protein [Methylobacteriaceae bacterium]